MKLKAQRLEAMALRDSLNAVNLLTVPDEKISELLYRNPSTLDSSCTICECSSNALVALTTAVDDSYNGLVVYICKPCALKALDLFKQIEVQITSNETHPTRG